MSGLKGFSAGAVRFGAHPSSQMRLGGVAMMCRDANGAAPRLPALVQASTRGTLARGSALRTVPLLYVSLLQTHPIRTKAVTAAVLNAVGDVVAQVALEGATLASFDYKRLGIFTFVGLALIGPALHAWYSFLVANVTFPGFRGTFLRMIMDQFLMAPVFISAILSSVMALEGNAASVPGKLSADLFTILRSNWFMWIPFQLFNFGVVPPHLQTLAANAMSILWNVYLSLVSHS